MDYTYSKDLLSAISTASGTDYSFTYGVFDLTTAVKAGSRTLISHSYTNDQNRRLSRSVYGNGDAVSYSYDSFGRSTSVTYGDTGSTVSYAYDANSNLGQLTDGISGRVNRYSYDFLDRLMRYEESGDGYSNIVQWGYDDENNLSSQTQTLNGTTYTSTYAYDKDNRLTKATEGAISANYAYDSFSRMSLFINAYDGDNTLTTSIGYRNPSSTSTSSQVSTWKVRPYGRTTYLYNGSYTYDTRGNILTVSDGTYTNSYHYDEFDRLVREDHEASGKTWVYTYDDGGNILSKKEYAYTTGALGTVRSTISYSYNNSEWRDLLTAYNGKSITYDAIGNPLSDGTWTYAWQHGRQLASMSKTGSSITYGYNADGKRISKTVNGTTYNYAYLGDALTDLSWGSNRMHFTYDSLGPASVTYNGTTYLYVKNAQGDVVQIVDGNGNTVVTYIYDAWGNMLYHYGSHVDDIGKYNPFRYRGYVYDTETGLYYLNSRYYNPTWGRFVNADTAAVVVASPDKANWDKNLFAYCDNNPISRKDDGGEFWETVFDVISLGVSVVEVCINPSDPWAWAGLIGDTIDLIPFVTGVGEVIRSIKTIDRATDTVQIAKAIDFTEDAANIVKALDRSSGFTKSTARLGRKIHDGYKVNCTPFVRQVWYNTCTKEWGVFSMPKGVPNKRYTPEFKKLVVETMQEEKLSYSETCRRFEVNSDNVQ